MPDSEAGPARSAREVGAIEPVEHRGQIARRDVAAAEAARCRYDDRNGRPPRGAVGEGSLDLAGQRVVSGSRLVRALDNGDGPCAGYGLGDALRREWPEGGDPDGTRTPALRS